MDDRFAAARDHFLAGVALFEASRFADAEQRLEASLALLPGRASTLVNLGATRLRLGRPAAALEALDAALAGDPHDAMALYHRAGALAQLGRTREALASCEAALAAAPEEGAAWSRLGQLQRELGDASAAATAFERAIGCGHEAELNRYFLAALRGGDAPPAAPASYLRALFDPYAADFERHLVDVLHYRGHAAVVQAARVHGPVRFRSALDLGCGTGLCGPLLRPIAEAIEGVDLSPAMLERARSGGAYDTLIEADLAEHLQRTPRRHDLIVAADVFIYVGDLEPVFAGVRRVLDPGGLFVFSIETCDGPSPWRLHGEMRYAHSEDGVRALARAHGLEVLAIETLTLREEQREAIAGAIVTLRLA